MRLQAFVRELRGRSMEQQDETDLEAVAGQETRGNLTEADPERPDGAQQAPVKPSPSQDRVKALIGKIVGGRYEVVSLLGHGGMSTVYLVKQILMKKVMALKMMQAHLATNEKSMQRFQQEAMAASKLEHRNIISIHDFGITEEDDPYLVMDYLQGTTLSDEIQKQGRLSIERIVRIFTQVCDALEHAHKNGVIHRDLKPSNIMLVESDGQKDFVKIVDFGIAKLVPQEGEEIQQLTQTGEIFGSPLYMSPEQCMGKGQDARSDIYSLGCVIYEAVTGHPPLVGTTVIETMLMHMNNVPEGLEKTIKDKRLREPLEMIIFGAVAKDPGKRYQSMSRLRDDLELLAKGSQTGWFGSMVSAYNLAQLKRGPQRKVFPLRLTLVAAASTLMLMAVLWWTGSVLLLPETTSYYQSALWPKFSPQEPPIVKDRDVEELEQKRQLAEAFLGTRKKFFGGESSEFYDQYALLAKSYKNHGRYDEAIPLYERAIQFRKRNSNDRPNIESADLHGSLGECHYFVGEYDKAAAEFEKTLNAIYYVHGETSNDSEVVLQRLLELYSKDQRSSIQHERVESVANEPPRILIDLGRTLERLRTIWRKRGHRQLDPNQGLAYCQYADVCRRLARTATTEGAKRDLEGRARALLEEAREQWQKLGLPANDPRRAVWSCGMAELNRQQKDWPAAHRDYQEALKVLQDSPGRNQHDLGVLWGNYAQFRWERKDYLGALGAKVRNGIIRFQENRS